MKAWKLPSKNSTAKTGWVAPSQSTKPAHVKNAPPSVVAAVAVAVVAAAVAVAVTVAAVAVVVAAVAATVVAAAVAGVAVIVAAAVAVAAITVAAAAAAGNPSAEPSSSIHSADPSQGPPFLRPRGMQRKLLATPTRGASRWLARPPRDEKLCALNPNSEVGGT